jgi:ribosomal protein L24E
MKTKTCAYCGNQFEATNGNMKYCSYVLNTDCASKAYYEKYYARTRSAREIYPGMKKHL